MTHTSYTTVLVCLCLGAKRATQPLDTHTARGPPVSCRRAAAMLVVVAIIITAAAVAVPAVGLIFVLAKKLFKPGVLPAPKPGVSLELRQMVRLWPL